MHNFSAGPAILPQSVFKEAAAAILNFNNTGLSILEISHRTEGFQEVIDEAEATLRSLLNISDEFAVLFMTGGASTQFLLSAMNLTDEKDEIAYINTGSWSTKAIKQAKLMAKVNIVGSSEESNFNYIPKNIQISNSSKYLHITSNNTIYGTQYHEWPMTGSPLVCDMSSDFLSRPFEVPQFGLIYAGAQKNVGPAGVTIVIVRKDWLNKVERNIPDILNYKTFEEKGSMFNTPPVFPIYVSMLTLRWLKSLGGLGEIAKMNAAKAKVLYEEIDDNPLFEGTANSSDRSLMNATFIMKPAYSGLAGQFLAFAEERNCSGIKGHRSVGGFRASMYNAMEIESVKVLAKAMKDFSKIHFKNS